MIIIDKYVGSGIMILNSYFGVREYLLIYKLMFYSNQHIIFP